MEQRMIRGRTGLSRVLDSTGALCRPSYSIEEMSLIFDSENLQILDLRPNLKPQMIEGFNNTNLQNTFVDATNSLQLKSLPAPYPYSTDVFKQVADLPYSFMSWRMETHLFLHS